MPRARAGRSTAALALAAVVVTCLVAGVAVAVDLMVTTEVAVDAPRRGQTVAPGITPQPTEAPAPPPGVIVVRRITQGVGSTSSFVGQVLATESDGSATRRLHALDGLGVRATDIAVSPDGRRLAFTQRSGPQDPTQLFVVAVDGSNRRQLTSGATDVADPALVT